jgi:hypothetical protein
MQLVGTADGEIYHPDSAFFKATPTGAPKFPRYQRFCSAKIKSLFGVKWSDLKVRFARAFIRARVTPEEEFAALTNPVIAAENEKIKGKNRGPRAAATAAEEDDEEGEEDEEANDD